MLTRAQFSPRYRGTDALEAPSVSWVSALCCSGHRGLYAHITRQPDYEIDHDEPTEVRPTTSRGLERLGYFDRNPTLVGGSAFFDHDLPPIAQNETFRRKWSTTLLVSRYTKCIHAPTDTALSLSQGLATTLVRKLHASRSSRRSRSSTSSVY